MRTRREFITLLGGAAAWPLAARAQQPNSRSLGSFPAHPPQRAAVLVARVRTDASCWCR
jgi:hypothetical protein